MSQESLAGTITMVNSIAKNAQLYTPRQFKRAQFAHCVYELVSCPSVRDFKKMVCGNLSKNDPITIDDINVTENVFSPDIGKLQGSTVRTKPTPELTNYVEVPPMIRYLHQDVRLSADVMFVN
mmetsp:Transcript_34817/g.80485  ORF Transcript_34817/g.80485 Transcript_34817/m.80485 type:complete len:123 (+) Transcript_34817:1516-1884(+)